jgi:hypothetical protein
MGRRELEGAGKEELERGAGIEGFGGVTKDVTWILLEFHIRDQERKRLKPMVFYSAGLGLNEFPLVGYFLKGGIDLTSEFMVNYMLCRGVTGVPVFMLSMPLKATFRILCFHTSGVFECTFMTSKFVNSEFKKDIRHWLGSSPIPL